MVNFEIFGPERCFPKPRGSFLKFSLYFIIYLFNKNKLILKKLKKKPRNLKKKTHTMSSLPHERTQKRKNRTHNKEHILNPITERKRKGLSCEIFFLCWCKSLAPQSRSLVQVSSLIFHTFFLQFFIWDGLCLFHARLNMWEYESLAL